MTRPISDLDVPLPVLEAQIRVQTLADARAHSHSPSDQLAYALDEWLVTHPDAPISSAADYPGWTPPHRTPEEAL